MFTTFSAAGPSRTRVADALVGAHAGDPVVPHVPARTKAPRTRSVLASALHRAGDAVAPGGRGSVA
jgi:hypothetical protein